VAPGLAEMFEADNPGMHTTDTVDYGICVRGEVWLELDDGAEERITPGTVVVQRGTRHAWHNRTNEVATVVYVLIGARRD
jgi:quercetin dioxygenase-like cupin family protein